MEDVSFADTLEEQNASFLNGLDSNEMGQVLANLQICKSNNEKDVYINEVYISKSMTLFDRVISENIRF